MGLYSDTSSSSMEGPKVSPISSPFGGEKQQWEKELDESPADMAPDSSSSTAALGQVFLQCWPVLGAIFFSGTFFVLAFPFFPYVPSDGTFGHELSRVSSLDPLRHHRLTAVAMWGVVISCHKHPESSGDLRKPHSKQLLRCEQDSHCPMLLRCTVI